MSMRKPSLRLHKPSQQAVVTIDGKDHYLGPWGSKRAKREYERLIREWSANGGLMGAAGRAVTVAELVLAYRRFAATYYAAPSREVAQIRLALRPLVAKYGHTLARDFGPLALKAVRQMWIEGGLARRYINQRVGRIVRAWGWAVENELLPAGNWQALLAVKGLQAGRTTARETAPVKPVSDSVFKATLAEIGSPQVRAMLQLIRITGARPGEVCIMRTGDIDRSVSPWEYRPQTHKTAYKGHERVICIGPRAQAVLADWLRADQEAFLFSRGKPLPPFGRQPSRRGALMRPGLGPRRSNGRRQPGTVAGRPVIAAWRAIGTRPAAWAMPSAGPASGQSCPTGIPINSDTLPRPSCGARSASRRRGSCSAIARR